MLQEIYHEAPPEVVNLENVDHPIINPVEIRRNRRIKNERKKKGEILDYGDFEEVLNTCEFSVKVTLDSLISDEHKLLGEISLYTQDNLDEESYIFR